MATVTNTGTGNYNSTTPNAPWPGGTVPGINDDVRLADGFTVTNPVGNLAEFKSIQPATADGTGIFINNGTVRYKGDSGSGKSDWVFGPGSVLEHDSSAAADPPNTHYTFQPGIAGASRGKFVFNGTPASRIILRNRAGSGKSGGFAGGSSPGLDCGQIVATSVYATGWGTSTLWFARPNLFSAGSKFTFDSDCILTDCGSALGNIYNSADYIFDGIIRTPAAAFVLGGDPALESWSANPTSGTRRIKSQWIEGTISCAASIPGADIGLDLGGTGPGDQLVALGSAAWPPFFSGGAAGKVKSANNVCNYNRCTSSDLGAEAFGGNINRWILLRVLNYGHHIEGVRVQTTVDNWYAESEQGNGGTGDIFQTEINHNGHYKAKFFNGLARYGPDGHSIGIVVNHSAAATTIDGVTVFGPQITAEHNTFYTDDGGTGLSMGVGGEDNNAFVGLVEHVRSNLVLRRSNGVGYVCKWFDGDVATLAAGTFANADYNALYNITNFPYYRFGTNPSQYNGTPGVHDVTIGNPQLVDDTRSFLSWAQTLDPSVTTWTQAIAKFSLVPGDAGYVAGFNISNFLDWVKAGFTPQNTEVNFSYPGDLQQYAGFAGASVVVIPPPPTGNPRTPVMEDLAEFITAPLTWAPDYSKVAAYRAKPHNGTWNDERSPATLVRRLIGYGVEYSANGPLTSPNPNPDGKYNVLLRRSSDGFYVVGDYLPGTGVGSGLSNIRTFPVFLIQNLLLACMSSTSNDVAYAVSSDLKLRKFSIAAGAITEVVGGHFPYDLQNAADFVTAGVFPAWLRHDGQDRKFTFSSEYFDAVWCFDAQTGTLSTLTGAALRADGSIPAGYTVNEGYVTFDGRWVLVSLTPGDSVVWDLVTGSHTRLSVHWSHGQVMDGGVFASYWWNRPNAPADMTITDEGRGYGIFAPVTVNGQAGPAPVHTEVNNLWNLDNEGDYEHSSTFWRQADKPFIQRWVHGYQFPKYSWQRDGSGNELPWAAYSGAIYRRPLGSIFGVNAMVESDGTGAAIRNMTKVTNLAALVSAGQWCLNSDGYAYAWRTDSGACTNINTAAIRTGLTPAACSSQQAGRTVPPRHIGYYYVHPATATYEELGFGNIGPDGTLMFINSNLGKYGDPMSLLVMELPTTDTGIVIGTAHHVSVDVDPVGTISGVPLTTQPVAKLRDSSGNVVTSYNGRMKAVVVSGGASLQNDTVVCVSGVATFTAIVPFGTSTQIMAFYPLDVSGVSGGVGSPFTLSGSTGMSQRRHRGRRGHR